MPTKYIGDGADEHLVGEGMRGMRGVAEGRGHAHKGALRGLLRLHQAPSSSIKLHQAPSGAIRGTQAHSARDLVPRRSHRAGKTSPSECAPSGAIRGTQARDLIPRRSHRAGRTSPSECARRGWYSRGARGACHGARKDGRGATRAWRSSRACIFGTRSPDEVVMRL